MNASVIVLSWNGMEYLADCLDAVLAQESPGFEVIVVDNGSSDGSADFVEEHYPQVQLIRNERNLGFAAGNNVGLRAATGDVLVLLNQDTMVQPGWLGAVVDTLDDPEVGIAGCKALYPDGTIQHAGGFVYGDRAETEHTGRFEPDDGRFDTLRDVDFVTGAGLGISQAALSRIGLLDEGFRPAYYEDVDWCYTAREAGFRVVYQPRAQLVHFESPTAQHESHRHKYALHRGRVRFVLKHWLARRLQEEFMPAEQEWVSDLGRTVEMMSVRRAYLVAMLDVEPIGAFRTRPDGVACNADLNRETLDLLRLMEDLRAACVADETERRDLRPRRGPALMPIRSAALGKIVEQDALLTRRSEEFAALRALEKIPRQSPKVRASLVGRLITRLRQLWQTRVVRPHFRPLLGQQFEFNTRLGDFLALLMQMDDQLRDSLALIIQMNDQLRAGLQYTELWNEQLERDVVENVREINELAQRLATECGASPPEYHERE